MSIFAFHELLPKGREQEYRAIKQNKYVLADLSSPETAI